MNDDHKSCRTCCMCGKVKPLGDFWKRASGRPWARCKICEKRIVAERNRAKLAKPRQPRRRPTVDRLRPHAAEIQRAWEHGESLERLANRFGVQRKTLSEALGVLGVVLDYRVRRERALERARERAAARNDG